MSTTWRKGRIENNNIKATDIRQPRKEDEVAETGERSVLFASEIPIRSLENLIVPSHTKEQIFSLIAKIQNHRVLYQDWGLQDIDPNGGHTAINLYGPPGTGKSFCAEAVANYLHLKLIRVNYAEIESKYVGETPKNIKAAFAKANEEGAVLFFDEADSILGKRLTNVTQSADHGVNVSRSVMLLELDRFSGVTIFATNLASNYDSAFVRRITGHVEMPLPDHECRVRLWNYHIPSKLPTSPQPFNESALSHLSKESDGLSGGDILNAVITAATYAVQREKSKQQVTIDDLVKAIQITKKAKQEVGYPTSIPLV
jgi:SpoVK/Ycf46/Vps4 family AAA+-type ATPase